MMDPKDPNKFIKIVVMLGQVFLGLYILFIVLTASGCAEKKEEEFEYNLRSQRFQVRGYRELNSTNSFIGVQGSLILELSLNIDEFTEGEVESETVKFFFANFRDIGTSGTCTGTFTSSFSEGRQSEVEDNSNDPFANYTPEGQEGGDNEDELAQRLTVYYRGNVKGVASNALGENCTFVVYPETYYYLRLYESGDIIIGDGQRNIEHLLKPIR